MTATLFGGWKSSLALGLYILWALLLLGGFVFGKAGVDGLQRMPLWTRLASSVILALIAWLAYVFSRSSALGGYALLIAIGMTLGLLGDLFLSNAIAIPQPTLLGIAAFGLGHICYLSAALRLAGQLKLDSAGPRWSTLALMLVIGLVAWYFVVYNGQKASVLTWAALPYALLLATVAGLFLGLALQSPAFIPTAIGALLFMASDLILASQLFTGRTFPLIGDVIWLTYGPAQALIVASVFIVGLTAGAALA